MSVIDANLPIFHLLSSKESLSETIIGHSQYNSRPTPKYLKRRDPVLSDTYFTTLHDAYHPDIIYASVKTSAIYPSPPQPTADEIRKRHAARQRALSNPNSVSPKEVELAFGEVAPLPPLVPAQVTINLYNPDSAVILTQKPSTWNSGPYFEFSLPKLNFMQPTGSKLDSDLGIQKAHLARSPIATFRWRKEGGVLSRASLRCSYVTGSSTLLHDDGGRPVDGSVGKRKPSIGGSSDPDITVAIFTNGIGGGKQQGRGEITVYEANLRKVEVDDIKGLELVLVMSAAVIGEIWYGDMKSLFNLSGKVQNIPSGPGRVAAISLQQQKELTVANNQVGERLVMNSIENENDRVELPAYDGPKNGSYPQEKVRPTQEELHSRAAEALRLRTDPQYQAMILAQQEAEARRLQEEFEREAREERRRIEENIERETERLRIEYGREQEEMRRRENRRSVREGLKIHTNLQSPNWPQYTQPASHPPPLVSNSYPPAITVVPDPSSTQYNPMRPVQNQQLQNGKFKSWFGSDKRKSLLTSNGEKGKKKSFMGLRAGFLTGAGGDSNDSNEGKKKDKQKAQSASPPMSSAAINSGAGPYGGLVEPGNGKLSKRGKLDKKRSSMW